MDATLHALAGILLRAIPTFLLVIFLNFYLKVFFFKPFQRVLNKRYEATEGARKMADLSIQKAAAKAAEYEAAVRAAKAEVYQAQERLHKELQEKQAEALAAARKQAEQLVKAAKTELARDVDHTKAGLERESDLLASQIAETILRRSAA